MSYPPGWPRCACGQPVLDGHLTCGRLECDEAAARERARRQSRVEMFLTDGRVVDLSGLPPDDAVRKITALGVRPDDIRETRHYVRTLQRDHWRVGDVARVGRPCLEHPAGSIAVVVEVYDRQELGIGDGHGITLLFERGAFDGFSAGDQAAFHVERFGHLPHLAAYRWQNAVQLTEDHRRGYFAAVWRTWV